CRLGRWECRNKSYKYTLSMCGDGRPVRVDWPADRAAPASPGWDSKKRTSLEDRTQRRPRAGNTERLGGGRNLTHSIVQDLGRAIVTGAYSQGRPFPYESELCAQYEASRPV